MHEGKIFKVLRSCSDLCYSDLYALSARGMNQAAVQQKKKNSHRGEQENTAARLQEHMEENGK